MDPVALEEIAQRLGDVVAQALDSGRHEIADFRCERKAHVPLTDDADADGALQDPAGELGRGYSRFMHYALSR